MMYFQQFYTCLVGCTVHAKVGSFHTVAFKLILENSFELYLHKKK